SFLAEYLYLNKPVMYLALNDGIRNYQNPFGNKAYDSCTKGKSSSDIENFLIDLIHHKAPVDRTFFDNELAIHFRELTPTMRIMNHLKEELKNC
ncbi:UDP-N-acetylglucosamine diphosphorylase, partial [Vibrio alginolyticus]|nr:UDP-N-acetylglucosamine diphosphorylase [Vibrio alginolyticus]